VIEFSNTLLDKRRQIIDEELRAICFSNPNEVKRLDELLLWSHYAKKHEGFRIGFEFPEEIKHQCHLKGIAYQQNRVVVDVSFGADPQLSYKALEESATVKSRAWEYEHEVRLFTKTLHCRPRVVTNPDSTSTLEHFFLFKREWVKLVDFGALCPPTHVQQVLALLKTDYPKSVIRRQAQFHQTEFALDYREL
jgi:hypothetical protein